MNNSSPLVPQGSMLEQKNRGRARVRIAVFVIISIHVVGLMGLLMLGCRKPAEPDQTMNTDTNTPAPPMADTNVALVDTNATMMASNPVPPMMQNTVPPVVTAGQDYAVQRGDNLSTIAKKFNVTLKALMDANPGVQPTRLQIAQKLHIPAPTPTATPGAAPMDTGATAANGDQLYTVKSGDNLIGIAKQYNTTVKAIRAENNLPTDRIRVGQKLKIPKGSTPAPATDASPSMTPPPAH